MFSKTTLPNGLRLITVPDKNAKTAAVLLLVGAGSKYETKKNNGISHFLEHMFFKGTRKRPTTLKLAETLDKVGGNFNAFTSKEMTGYWAKVDAKHLHLALDWVADIFLNSKIEAKEIEKEKGVIIEELNMYLDMPMRYIADLWEELLYGNQPAGWKTLGQKENIRSFQRKDFLGYLAGHYSAANTLVCLAGNLKNEKLKVQKLFKKIRTERPKKKIEVIEKQKEAKALLHFKETDQSHLWLGVRGFDLFSPEKYAQQILAVILGGNMSSRLFISIREKKGLAYYIRTLSELYTDSGYLVSQAGVPHKNLKEAVTLILKEYSRMKEKGISQEELQKAKDYLKGSALLQLESPDAQASFYGVQELLSGKILTIEEKFRMIDKVSRQDVKNVAQKIFQPDKLNLALIGPHKNKGEIKKILII